MIRKIRASNAPLAAAGWFCWVVALLAICSAPWDTRLVNDASVWWKPMRYGPALAIYAWTMALLLAELPEPRWARRVVGWGAAACVALEAGLIAVQAMRGVDAHFSVGAGFDLWVFGLLTLAMLANTMLVFMAFFFFLWQEIELPRAYLMGIRLGLVLFILGSLLGVLMLLNEGHMLGAGDLRIGHLLGMSALPLMPLTGYLVSRKWGAASATAQIAAVTGAALVWVFVFARAFHMAAHGRPVL